MFFYIAAKLGHYRLGKVAAYAAHTFRNAFVHYNILGHAYCYCFPKAHRRFLMLRVKLERVWCASHNDLDNAMVNLERIRNSVFIQKVDKTHDCFLHNVPPMMSNHSGVNRLLTFLL